MKTKHNLLLLLGLLISQTGFGQYMYLNTSQTSFEVTPTGISSKKTGATYLNTYTLGFDAGRSLLSGNYNTAIGYFALADASSSIFNTAVGSQALRHTLNGFGNTALGFKTLYENTSGSYNLGVGPLALYANISGSQNVAIGKEAMYFSQTGKNNVALGNYALYHNGGNIVSSVADSNSLNVAIGHYAMLNSANQSGYPSHQNVAVGHNTAQNGGYRGVSIGYKAAEEAFQMGVTIGNLSGKFVKDATIIGDSVMISASSNSSGNTVIGHKAMKNAGNNTVFNTAIGYETMQNMTTPAGKNTVVGDLSMKTAAGFATENTIFGAQSMLNFDAGSYNTGVGNASFPSLTNSSYNTAIGWFSGTFANTDNKITSIGAFSGVNNSATVVTNATTIGYAVVTNTSNSVKIGNASVAFIGGYQNFTNFSDKRLKRKISYKNTPGLDFVLGLKTAKYQMIDDPTNTRYGLIAQDLHALTQETKTDFPALNIPKQADEYYSIGYEMLTVPLINAVKELDQKITVATQKNAEALEANATLRAELELLTQKNLKP
jgi:trimeric autotransporter adhesin